MIPARSFANYKLSVYLTGKIAVRIGLTVAHLLLGEFTIYFKLLSTKVEGFVLRWCQLIDDVPLLPLGEPSGVLFK
jgi:hypothetical protein